MFQQRNGSERKSSVQGLGHLPLTLWIHRLVKINPQHTGKKSQHGGEGQEQHDRPDCNLIHTPMGQNPQYGAKNNGEGDSQTVTDVHGSEKISRLAIEMQTAGRTAIMHFGEAPIDGRAEDSC